jgi:hypothetical protein
MGDENMSAEPLLHLPGSGIAIGSREEINQELQMPPPGGVVSQRLIDTFQTPARLMDAAGRIEAEKSDADSLALAQLLRKVAKENLTG